jgi:predicted RNA-binding Zn ribbon-like protein
MPAQQAFELMAGCPALCLVDTVSQRGGPGIELLRTPGSLARWLRAADLATINAQTVSQEALLAARALREAIHRCGVAVIGLRPMAEADVDLINQTAAKPPLRPRLIGQTLVQVGSIEAALSTLAADALRVLATPALRLRVRVCAGCQMMFLDTSRPGRRRWCSSSSGCGNRAKVRNLRARRRQSSTGSSTHD